LHVGVDIGGTFTDLVLSDAGRLTIHKLLSTPDDPSRAMLVGLEAVTSGGLDALRQVSHGSTVATNAILERKGAKTALITTKGFRDLLFIGRQNRPQLYALQPTLPPPLIPRGLCFEVPERLDYTGAVLTSLDMAAIDAVLDGLAEQAIEAVAVCFLYSYVNPAHEQAVRARILERGLLAEEQIALSCEVLPEFREYERASTVALDAYVRPVMSRYLRHLENQLPESCGLRVMKSDGGVFSTARAQAVQTALSGPAAGVIGAFHVAMLAGYDQIITLDIGGTSTDVALCPGRPVQRPESEIDGLPLRIRLLDIETIGAGGGSIARVDAGGALRVGPESAGANPGPVCYGRGGTLPTVSDANAVLGRLDASHFLGGRMALNVEAARAALAELGGRMGVSAEAAAAGIIQVANANIDRAVRRVSVARGYDPRDFTLVAFGGAGPLHACEVADRLDIPRVLLPRYPGVMCALGLLVADVALEYSRSILQPLTNETVERIAAHLASMRETGVDDLTREGIPAERQQFRPLLDMRYAGQAYELSIPLSLDKLLTTAGLAEAFHAAHERAYGYALGGRAIEAVNVRLQAVGITDKPAFEPEASEAGNPINTPRPEGQKDAAGVRLSLFNRDSLQPGEAFDGPALAFQLDSTAYIPAGWRARVDVYRNLMVERR
jgi:N-methylhydantoinase A